jgi:hypothetical protein
LFFVPESPRWLISKDRAPEALQILAKYHANGDEHDPTVMFEFAEIKETIRLEYLFKRQTHYIDFVKTRGNRYRLFLIITLGLFSQWSGNGLASYYFKKIMDSIGVTEAETQFYVNGSLVVVSLIVSVSCAFLVDRVGRRPLFLVATSGMLIMFVLWTVCTSLYEVNNNIAAGKAVVAIIFLYSISYAFAWSGLLVAYTVEILPFKLRAKGLMLMNFFVQSALVFNQYINPVGLKHLQPTWKYETIYCCWIAFELLIVFFFYVETRGPTLEEIAKIFDKEEANYGVANVQEVKNNMSKAQDMEMGKFGTFTKVERAAPSPTFSDPGSPARSIPEKPPPPNFSRVERQVPPRPRRIDRTPSGFIRPERTMSPTDFTRMDDPPARDRGGMF